jgi:hypothetical protein
MDTRRALALAMVAMLATRGVAAQSPAVTGTVVDESGRPIAEVQLVVESDIRQATSNDSGRFRLSLPAGEYQLIARRLGFVPTRQRVRLTQGVVELRIVMRELPLELRTMISQRSHVGLTGVVLDSAGNGSPVVLRAFYKYYTSTAPDQLVARGSHQLLRTEADGAFFAPLPPGTFVLQVEKGGKSLGIVRVFIPPSGRRCIVVRLDAFDKRGQQRAEGCSDRDIDTSSKQISD